MSNDELRVPLRELLETKLAAIHEDVREVKDELKYQNTRISKSEQAISELIGRTESGCSEAKKAATGIAGIGTILGIVMGKMLEGLIFKQ